MAKATIVTNSGASVGGEAGADWEAIRDLRVREAELQSVIEGRRLGEARKVLEERKGQIGAEIDRMDEKEANLRAHAVIARQWLALTVFALGIALGSAWWTVGWFTSLSWEKGLLAVTLVSLPVIGWMLVLPHISETIRDWNLRKVFVAAGATIVLCSLAAVASLGGARMVGVALQEEQHELRTDDAPAESAAAQEARQERIEWVKRLLYRLTVVAVVLLAIAGEVAAGVAFHEYYKRSIVVRTAQPFYDEQASLSEALAANATAAEEAKQWPEILHARLTAEALQKEADAVAAAAAEERRLQSIIPTMKWVLIGFAVLLVGLLVAATVFGEEAAPQVTVVLLDRSTSMKQEFVADLRVMDQILAAMPAGGTRLTVLAIDEGSFGGKPLFVAQSPIEAGRFGEHLDRWRVKTERAWRKAAESLTPTASGSDILGAVGRAALEFDDAQGAAKRLVIVSDMRQVGRGMNFERSVPTIRDAGSVKEPAALSGVAVWVLGAHTAGIDERHWWGLREFWGEYFRRAGAELKVFSPNRVAVVR